ncbi:MAG: hypothetical protein GY788_23060 [bacterium]|nr:hypothetical protein [bacterium]
MDLTPDELAEIAKRRHIRKDRVRHWRTGIADRLATIPEFAYLTDPPPQDGEGFCYVASIDTFVPCSQAGQIAGGFDAGFDSGFQIGQSVLDQTTEAFDPGFDTGYEIEVGAI